MGKVCGHVGRNLGVVVYVAMCVAVYRDGLWWVWWRWWCWAVRRVVLGGGVLCCVAVGM